jgi:cob(I)alamin adenosyltransferase
MSKLDRGFVHVYTGDGKGKTTAAFGLALRAAGADFKVAIIQFMKGQAYSEIRAIQEFLPQIRILQTGRSKCIRKEDVNDEDRSEAQHALYHAREALDDPDLDMLILDEILVAHWFELVSLEEILRLIDNRPPHLELVMTGRKAPKEVMQRADLVTEMLEIKHYYKQGIPARRGIES